MFHLCVELTKISDTADAAGFHKDVFAFEITMCNARLACNQSHYYNITSVLLNPSVERLIT